MYTFLFLFIYFFGGGGGGRLPPLPPCPLAREEAKQGATYKGFRKRPKP